MKSLYWLCMVCIVMNLIVSNSYSQSINGTFAIKNVKTGIFLRIKDANKSNGTSLVAYSPVNWKCATWDFNHTEGKNYQLKNLFTGKTFQSHDVVPTDGSVLGQQPLIANEVKQEYEFIPVEKNVYLIRLKNTDLYITPGDSNGTINSRIILARKNGSNLQNWTLQEQKPEI